MSNKILRNIKEKIKYDHEVNLLREKDWVIKFNDIPGGWHFVMKNLRFSELIINKSTAGISMEKKINFLAFLPVVSPNEMTSEKKALFKRLKQYECSLKHEGLLGNKLLFDVRPELHLFSKAVEDFKPNKKLANLLNLDSEIINFIQKHKPGSLVVALQSLPLGIELKKNDAFSLEFSFFSDPSFITWVIYLSMIIPNWEYTKTFINAISLIDRISCYLLEVSK
ncbi:MAG: hypothetical protein ACP5KW_08930 [Thermoproteota archaeon]